jgi:hypothetical protein
VNSVMREGIWNQKNLTVSIEDIPVVRIEPAKLRKRRQHFVKVPWAWIDKLNGASGSTYRVALSLLYLHWKGRGGPIKLANGALLFDGVSRYSKWRVLNDLERRGLITVERRSRKSPLVRLVA